MSVCINVERSTVAVELNLESVVEPHVVAGLENFFLLLHIRDSDARIALLDIFLSWNRQLVDREDLWSCRTRQMPTGIPLRASIV